MLERCSPRKSPRAKFSSNTCELHFSFDPGLTPPALMTRTTKSLSISPASLLGAGCPGQNVLPTLPPPLSLLVWLSPSQSVLVGGLGEMRG